MLGQFFIFVFVNCFFKFKGRVSQCCNLSCFFPKLLSNLLCNSNFFSFITYHIVTNSYIYCNQFSSMSVFYLC